MRFGIAILFMLIAVIFVSPVASAHVLVMDSTSTSGAILHIMPDDDPIAGEAADIYFDRQSGAGEDGTLVSLRINNADGESTVVETETKNALTTARYTFPQQGVYVLTFTVTEDERELVFEQSQRVTRGIASGTAQAETYIWAEALVTFCVVGFLALAVIIFNRRREIKKYSTF